MSYYYNKFLHNTTFEEVLEKVTRRLKDEGFSVLTEIDVQDTIKKNLHQNYKKYKILGACNPVIIYEALDREDKIGSLLPCNIIIQERSPLAIEVTAIDPVSSMPGKGYKSLENIVADVQNKLKKVIDKL